MNWITKFLYLDFKRKSKNKIREGEVPLEAMRSYPVKENPIGLAVTNRQTNKQTDRVLHCFIDIIPT